MFEKYAMIVIYFSILMVLGYIASKRVRNMNDFVIGGKTLSYWVAAFSAQATGESAWLLLGLTGMGAMLGFSTYWSSSANCSVSASPGSSWRIASSA